MLWSAESAFNILVILRVHRFDGIILLCVFAGEYKIIILEID